jgi:hypothetical protein
VDLASLHRLRSGGLLQVDASGVFGSPSHTGGEEVLDALDGLARAQVATALELLPGGAGPSSSSDGARFHPFVVLRRGPAELRAVLAYETEREAIRGAARVLREHPLVEALVLVCDGVLGESGELDRAIVVRAQHRSWPESVVFAQRYGKGRVAESVEPRGEWLRLGRGESLFPQSYLEPDPLGPSPELKAFVAGVALRQIERLAAQVSTLAENELLCVPLLVVSRGGGNETVAFPMASLTWAEESLRAALAERAGADFAVLLSDDALTSNGRPYRRLRLRGQTLREDHSWVFTQGYRPARSGARLARSGSLRVVGLDASLLSNREVSANSAVAFTAEAEFVRRLVELGRPSVETLRAERTSILQHAGPAVRRTTDPTSRIPFAASKLEFDEMGLRAWFGGRESFAVPWRDLVGVRVRELPPDSPWERAVVLELVPAAAAGTGRRPIRLVRTTSINFRSLPGRPGTTVRENIRRLGAFVVARNPATRVDPESLLFFEGGPCPKVAALADLVVDDGAFD